MQELSVIIICKNEAHIVHNVIKSVLQLTDDIIVADTGSRDNTIAVAKQAGARIAQLPWQGFGPTKNNAIAQAKYDWILSLDADEIIDGPLLNELLQLNLNNTHYVYNLRFRNFLGNKALRFGEWGNDKHIRLFNRTVVQWNDAFVHEQLNLPADAKKILLNGFVLHKTAEHLQDYIAKLIVYADLNARKYSKQGKSSGKLITVIRPLVNFIQNYFFRLGFLDGYTGFVVARAQAFYTFLKYARLKELNDKKSAG